ncbi:rhamnan synthesis F family protein [Pseudomonas sp. Marseille-QA0892]
MKKISRLTATSSNTPLALGNRALREGRYVDAIEHYERAAKQAPELKAIISSNVEIARRRSKLFPKKGTINIVVPVFNALGDVKLCLESLERHTDGYCVRVIVVNDGSDAKTTHWLRQRCQANAIFKLIENAENFGYTRTVNIGLRESNADFVITQNSDTVVTEGWLSGMVRCMESDPAIGVVGPLSNAASWQNVPALWDESGSFAINKLPTGIDIEGMARIVSKTSQRVYPRLPFVNGFCFMIRRAVIDAIGYMDEANFPVGYGEENDFCIRAVDAGFELAVADDVFVYHAKSKSFGHEKRQVLSEQGTHNLKKKHTSEKFVARMDAIKRTEKLDVIRSNIQNAIQQRVGEHQNIGPDEVRLVPGAAFSVKGYCLEPVFSTPVINQPFAEPAGSIGFLGIDLGLHLHLHYLDLLEEFIAWLKNITIPFALYVSVPDIKDCDKISVLLNRALPLVKVDVRSFPNRGRDIGPFLAGFGADLKKHKFIGHIHSKRSPHNPAKRDWRTQLMTHLMGSKGVATANLRLLAENAHLGMIFPEYHWSLANQIAWGTNYPYCQALSARMNIDICVDRMVPFPAGSMFFSRTEAILPLLNLSLTFNDFPEETAQVDGTLAHAVERLFGNVVLATGMTVQQVRCEKAHDLLYYYTAANPYSVPDNEFLPQNISSYHAVRSENIKAEVGLLTANAGSYDPVVVHEALDPEIDYIYMTDTEMPDYGFWKVQPLVCQKGSEIMAARRVKSSAPCHLQGYRYGIWVDANVLIRRSLRPYLDLAEANPNVPIFGIPHPVRSCIYEEAEAVVEHGKANQEKVEEQMIRYAAEGFPKKYGLIETNFLLFNLSHPLTPKIFELWAQELESKTHRDQLSLNYVLWKLNAEWLPLMAEGHSLRDCPDFAYFGHGGNSGYRSPKLQQLEPISTNTRTVSA